MPGPSITSRFYAGKWQSHVPVLFKEIPLDIEIYFTERERDFYAALQRQGALSCRELISRLNILPMDFWRSVLAFHLLGILEFEKRAAGGDISRDIAALLALNQKMQDRSLSDLELLGLPPAAAAAAVEKRPGRAAGSLRSRALWLGRRPGDQEDRLPGLPAPAGAGSALGCRAGAASRKTAPGIFNGGEIACQSNPYCGDVPARKFSPAAAPRAATLAESAHERAWALLLQGKDSYERREFDKAIPMLKQAIKLEPGQGDFYYLLGLCQSEVEIMKNDAEINLKKAVELKSWSADPVYALGVLYRGQGKMKLAERCFQRVKEIAHDHTGASRELVDLRRQKAGSKDKAPFLKKKIF